MDVYVTIVRYNDSYQTTLKEVWFNEEAARNRCKMPLYHSGDMFDVESYELYKIQLNTPWEVGGIRNEEETTTDL